MSYIRLKEQHASLRTINVVMPIRLLIVVALILTVIAPGSLLRAAVSVSNLNDDAKAINDNEVISLQSFYTVDAKISANEKAYFEASASQAGTAANRQYARAHAGPISYDVVNVEFDTAKSCNRFKVAGAFVFNRFDRFADVFIRIDEKAKGVWEAVRKASGVVWVERAATATTPPQPEMRLAPRTKQPPEPIVRGGIQGLTGQGVIIAIVDSGLDFRNPDFIIYDSAGNPTSRLLYLLDTTSDAFDSMGLGTKPPLSYPNGLSIGTLYTRAQLTAELRSPMPRIPASDLNSHGTGCAGIAAGNGNNAPDSKYIKGVAPDADIIAVRIGGNERGTMENSYLLNTICGWLDQVAGSNPLVISCSFGSSDGGHDGQRVVERQLNARFPLNRKGRAIVIAAGNEGANPIHSEVSFKGKDDAGLMLFTTDSENAYLYIYFNTGDKTDLYVSPAAAGMDKQAWVNPFTKQVVMYIQVRKGEGKVRLFNLSGKTMKADAYIFNGKFKPGSISYNKLVSSPGTTENAITVTSYDWNDIFDTKTWNDSCGSLMTVGGLSCYSSLGYTRIDSVKPDIAAPGQYYSASYARKQDGSGVNKNGVVVDAAGKYRLFNGTSAAAPYTAGVIALIMQKKPVVTITEIKELLRLHATNTKVTGNVPNPKWGYGKLDLAAVERIIKAVS